MSRSAHHLAPRRLGWIVALSLISAITGAVPLIAIVELARRLLPTAGAAAVDSAQIWVVVAVVVGSSAVSLAAAFASGVVSHLTDASMQLSVRRRVIEHLRRLPLGWFDSRNSGAVRKLVEGDVAALHHLVAHAIHDVVTAIAVPAISLTYLFLTDWRVALAAMVPVVAAMWLYLAMIRSSSEKFAQYDRATEQLAGATVEFVHGIAVVKRFGQLGRSHRRYREKVGSYVDFMGQWTRQSARTYALIEMLTSPVTTVCYLLVVGAWMVSAGTAKPIDILPGVILGLGLTAPILKLGMSAQFLRNAALARQSLTDFLALAPIVEAARPQRTDGHAVHFDGLSFSYDGHRQALRDIVAGCQPGAVTALVGASGSGKSTLARLVPRFYDVSGGAVRLGGTDVRDIATADLYGQVGFVFQEIQLLQASLRDNLRLAYPDASDEQIVAACRAAQIHDRILQFERGYDAVIGEDAHLSGGEAQRVTIARALLADAPVLVLDEATAFADPDSEAAIQAALSALAVDRTVLVIAHRLHTIVDVDRILVLDQGRIVDDGTHAELLAAGGPYARLWENYCAGHGHAIPLGADQ